MVSMSPVTVKVLLVKQRQYDYKNLTNGKDEVSSSNLDEGSNKKP